MSVGRRREVALCAVVALATGVAACGGGGSSTNQAASGDASNGKSLTVVTSSAQWPSLGPPPATESPIFVVNFMNAIYGQLFVRQPNGSIAPGLASGYKYVDGGRTVQIAIRPSVKFSDGTPFTAAAVAQQFKAAINPKNACSCLGSFSAISSITTSGNKVLLRLSRPDVTIIQSIISNPPNWVPSPHALASMGAAAFGQHPVGAGPFEVVSNAASSKLVLKRNPHYYVRGEPKLASLTFVNVASDQSAFAALTSGTAQFALGIATPSILQQAKSQYNLYQVGGITDYEVLFNTRRSPFTNQLAREAVAYATDPQQTLSVASPGFGTLTQSPTGPSGLFSESTVPGTRAHNLAKAKALVKQLGGLSFEFYYPTNQSVYQNGAQSLARQWEAAGMKVSLLPVLPTVSAQKNRTGNWNAQFTTAGAVDPDISITGLPNRYGSKGGLTCCSDPTLDAMINKSVQTSSPAQRKPILDSIYKYINEKQYSVNLFSLPTVDIAAKSVTGVQVAPNASAGKEIISWEKIGGQ